MARQVLPIAGAIVGGAFGAPQLGFAIGSIIGNVVDPVKIQGPKIGDLQVQTSRDGVPRPVVFAKAAVMGNIIDRGEPKIVKKKERAGKGGPVTITERAYISFAIRICEGPVVGISRVWENEKLVYDGTAANTIPNDSAKFLAKTTIYLGGESQMPDPTLEVIHGVGSTPAYRGTCYAVFKNKDVTDTGGAIPQYRFEVDGVVVPPTGNWLLSAASGCWQSPYATTSWADVPVLTGTESTFDMVRGGNYVFGKDQFFASFFYCPISNLGAWVDVTVGFNCARLLASSTYIHLYGGGASSVRRYPKTLGSLTTGAAFIPYHMLAVGDTLYALNTDGLLYKTTDNGDTFATLSGAWLASGSVTQNPSAAINSSGRIVVVYSNDISGTVTFKTTYTDDYGATFSGAVTHETAAGIQTCVHDAIVWDGTNYVIMQKNGKNWRSSTGASWTANTQITLTGSTPELNNLYTDGAGIIFALGNNAQIYKSTNSGQSWATVSPPTADVGTTTTYWNMAYLG